MPKNITPEQAAKRDERKARFREFVDNLAAMTDEQRQEIVANLPGLTTVEGHLLSEGNACLIYLQNPQATMVGGFKQWIKMGRCVRKGEQSMMIWVPTKRKESNTESNSDEPKRPGFIVRPVFDISQTELLKPEEPTRCPCGFPHPPHDLCDGNPGATFGKAKES